MPIAASAWPSGPVDDAAFEHIAGRICDAVARGCDGVLLDLHGAMVTQSHEDGEGELLRRIRAIAADVPIGVALDMHTNLYDGFARRRDRDRRLPDLPARRHVRDRAARRPRAARAAARARRGRRWPGAAGRCCRTSCARAPTTRPNRELQARCREMEARGRALRQRLRRLSERRHRIRRPVGGGRHRRRRRRSRDAGATSCSTWPGSSARSSSTRSSRSPSRWRAPARSPTPSRPAAARSCCSTTATTAPPAARWTR